MRYWLAVGVPDNWRTAFELGNTWGLKAEGPQATAWKRAEPGDFILFYATSPVRGLIDYGQVQQKVRQDQPLWPEEIQRGEVIWSLHLTFEVKFCLPSDRWGSDKVVDDRINFRAKMGFREVPEDVALAVVQTFPSTEPTPEHTISEHEALVQAVLEIGRLQHFVCDKEYRMDSTRLDAVWRRVERSVPNYVFEVQIGGNPYQALAKLKHAFDLWNSNIYLVVRAVSRRQIEDLLSGTFHEIGSRVNIVEEQIVRRLVELKREVRDLEAHLGLALPRS